MQFRGIKLNVLWKILKILIPIASIIIIYFEITESDNFDKKDLLAVVINLNNKEILLIICATLLLLVNWGIETLKWKTLIDQIEFISFVKAYKAVLSGISASIIFPFQAGEYLGRVSFLKYKLRGSILTVVGSMTQLVVTLLIGGLALLFYSDQGVFEGKEVYLLCISMSILIILVFAFKYIKAVLKHLLPKKIYKYFRVLNLVNNSRILGSVQLLSLLRYMVFITQYILVLVAFNVNYAISELFYVVAIMYLAMTIVPINKVIELGAARAAIIIALLSQTLNWQEDYDDRIAMATFTIWLINIGIPALVGAIVLLTNKEN